MSIPTADEDILKWGAELLQRGKKMGGDNMIYYCTHLKILCMRFTSAEP